MKLIKCSPEAREKCKFDHPCDSEEKAFFEEGSPCDAFNKSLLPPPTQTNAQKIRAMTDKELAEWMAECNAYGERAIASQWLPWLQQPVKEGADHE